MLVPTPPEVGLIPKIVGVVVTVNEKPLLAAPPTVTTMFPVVAPGGTCTLIAVEFQLVGVAATPSNVIVLDPWFEPKLNPAIRTLVPTPPVVGLIPEIEGADVTVNGNVLLATPPTVTRMFPVVAPDGTVVSIPVAPQLVTEAVTPLKVTVLDP
jgi:hypothetical protein